MGEGLLLLLANYFFASLETTGLTALAFLVFFALLAFLTDLFSTFTTCAFSAGFTVCPETGKDMQRNAKRTINNVNFFINITTFYFILLHLKERAQIAIYFIQ
jgi:hypothetical protein